MTTDATRLRDAIVARLENLSTFTAMPYVTVRKTPLPQLQPDRLPALSVFIVGEELTPDGDGNTGPLKFISAITIGISDMRGVNHPTVLDGTMDDQIGLIEQTLFCDPTFARGTDTSKPTTDPDRYPYFEAVSKIERQRVMPQNADTYVAEVRIAMTFLKRVAFAPVLTDHLVTVDVTARQAGYPTQSPPVRAIINPPQ